GIILLSASPIGEFLIAYPTALALGLDPLVSLFICILSNLTPIPILIIFSEKIKEKFPKFFNWLARRSRSYENYIKKLGKIAFIILTPIIGVYATTLTLILLGFNKIETFLIQSLSLVIYGVLMYFGLITTLYNI
ncbi:MAG: small multi-drug export protein, partial [Sulfolobaceae archaeon]